MSRNGKYDPPGANQFAHNSGRQHQYKHKARTFSSFGHSARTDLLRHSTGSIPPLPVYVSDSGPGSGDNPNGEFLCGVGPGARPGYFGNNRGIE